MDKVVHVTDSIHAQAKAYCKQRGINLKDWVSQLIEYGISNVIPITRGVPVEKKTLPKFERSDVPNAYEEPPFWDVDNK